MASACSDDPYYESEGADDRKIIVRMLNYKTTNETIKEYFGKIICLNSEFLKLESTWKFVFASDIRGQVKYII